MNRLLDIAVMIFIAASLYAVISVTTGCDRAVFPKGIYVDTSLEEYLQNEFDHVKNCTDLPKGTFSELTILMTSPSFPCAYSDACDGEYIADNEDRIIKLGTPYSIRHEALHHILYTNTGDADPNHTFTLRAGGLKAGWSGALPPPVKDLDAASSLWSYCSSGYTP